MTSSTSLLVLFIASTSSLPFPQLTEEQFSARARSLDEPNNVFITNSYTQVNFVFSSMVLNFNPDLPLGEKAGQNGCRGQYQVPHIGGPQPQ